MGNYEGIFSFRKHLSKSQTLIRSFLFGDAKSLQSRIIPIYQRKVEPGSTSAETPPVPQAVYCSNAVTTAKYNIISFLPRFLYEQFSKYANIFFLFTAIIQQIDGVSPTSRYATLVPLVLVLTATAIKEILEDLRRHAQDSHHNRSIVRVFNRAIFETDPNTRVQSEEEIYAFEDRLWQDLKVGDIIRVESGQSFPADLLLLASSEPEGMAYIETGNLDGETNLKIRQAKRQTSGYVSSASLAELSGRVFAEHPNNAIYHFEGNLELKTTNPETQKSEYSESTLGITDLKPETISLKSLTSTVLVPLDVEQVLLRGSILRNTKWIFGLVLYTGHETKVMQNAAVMPIKRTALERMTNVQIIFLFIALVCLALISSLASVWWIRKYDKFYSYLDMSSDDHILAFLFHFLTFVVLYNNLIPISLVVTMELVKYQQAKLINADLDMYDAATDTPSQARTSTLVEELGQVQYIFSDKTGTLTCNKMEFQHLLVEGKRIHVDSDESIAAARKTIQGTPKDSPLHSFLLNLAVCHTVIPEGYVRGTDTVPNYQASSPDEVALVRKTAQLGFIFAERTPSTIQVVSFDTGRLIYKNRKQYSPRSSSPVKINPLSDLEEISTDSEHFDTNRHPLNDNIIRFASGDSSEPNISTYKVLHVLPFNSTRKRMSVLLQKIHTPITSNSEINGNVESNQTLENEEPVLLFCKGADSVILERLSMASSLDPSLPQTLTLLEESATQGLRTLCLAMRIIDPGTYKAWASSYQKALGMTNVPTPNNRAPSVNRQAALDSLSNEMEQNLTFLGGTAIQDQLQDKVPETIATLIAANMKVWMLTGDKTETAITVGYACRLIHEADQLLVLDDNTIKGKQDLMEILQHAVTCISPNEPSSNINGKDSSSPDRSFPSASSPPSGIITATRRHSSAGLASKPFVSPSQSYSIPPMVANPDHFLPPDVLVIDGAILTFALAPDLEMSFFKVASQCSAVLCCRVSPLQKALVVRLMKRLSGAITLAIGDGANDVSMLQAADIGVGITGLEGTQAARAADYALAQFKFLSKLLLVHGSWAHHRLSKLILYSFYKNIALYMTQFWFSAFNLSSGQTLYESWLITLYNVIFTFFPPIMIGVTDQHLTAQELMEYPQLYALGQAGGFFTVRAFWGWAGNALWHSLVLFGSMYAFVDGSDWILPDGKVAGHWALGCLLYTAVLVTVLSKAALILSHWTKFAIVSIPGSLIAWFLFLPFYDSILPRYFGIAEEIEDVSAILYTTPAFWLFIFIIPMVCLYRDVVWKYIRRQYLPKSYHIVQEFRSIHTPGYRAPQDRLKSIRDRLQHRLHSLAASGSTSSTPHRGYAFSQSETGQAELIRRYDSTIKSGNL